MEGEDAARQPGEPIYTAVAEAKAYAERTGVDCLAISVGTVHGRTRSRPKLDLERLKRINSAVRLPLVIHGGSGLTEDQYRRLISGGVAKINYYTALADVAGKCIRENARTDVRGDYTGLVNNIRERIRCEVEHCMHLWSSAGRAAEVLVQCRSWQPVQHVIIYNVEHGSESQVDGMMTRGAEVLAKIPGVRRVVSGWAVSEKPKYRFCWIVEFAHERVIESYRDHPEHVAFANSLFRPLAGDRVSIDFVEADNTPATHPTVVLRQMHG
jgi:fructose-bisphosphate aldolase class II